MSNQEVDGFKAVIESEPIKNITNPPTKSIGKALGDICDLCFGKLGETAEKSRIKHQKNIEDFKASLYNDIKNIPEENLIEPKLSVVGPALEASKFYYEEDELRKMFERLIVNSMDSRKISNVHPSFTEIIKQLSPLDAQNLTLFRNNNHLPLCEYRSRNELKTEYNVIKSNVFLSNLNCTDIDLQGVSISSLSRLELISINYEKYITNDAMYKIFENNDFYRSISSLYKSLNQKIIVRKGVAIITPLGLAFTDVCLSPLPITKTQTT
ncbi:MAG: DUF4393 domain-containing protein [Ruminococcus sp.]|nr:DUF4393 domain-containing protein [Ruminococcus sp.]